MHVRVAECLRAIARRGSMVDCMSTGFAAELARRGVLDPVRHFERYEGDVRSTKSAELLVRQACILAREWGLMVRIDGHPGYHGITPEGRRALSAFDDVSAPNPHGSAARAT